MTTFSTRDAAVSDPPLPQLWPSNDRFALRVVDAQPVQPGAERTSPDSDDSATGRVERLGGRLVAVAEDALPRLLARHADQIARALGKILDLGCAGERDERVRHVLEQTRAVCEQELRQALHADDSAFALFRTELNGALRGIARHDARLKRQIATLTERLAASEALNEAHRRAIGKSVGFDWALRRAVESIFAPYADAVADISTGRGGDNGSRGDLLVTLNGAEAPQPTRIVIEAIYRKQPLGMTLAELSQAMQRHGACIGLAVFANLDLASTHGHSLRLYDSGHIVCTFDDARDRLPLEVACQLSRALARTHADRHTVATDLTALPGLLAADAIHHPSDASSARAVGAVCGDKPVRRDCGDVRGGAAAQNASARGEHRTAERRSA